MNYRCALPGPLKEVALTFHEFANGGAQATVELKDGRKFEKVLISNSTAIIAVRGFEEPPFDVEDIARLYQTDVDKNPTERGGSSPSADFGVSANASETRPDRQLLARMRASLLCLAMLVPAYGAAIDLPIIDAHSQFDENVPAARLIEYAARAGVTQVLLSARGAATTAHVLDLASKYPGCILPSVRTKGREFADNRAEYYAMLSEQLKEPAFKAMSEIILVHAAKGRRAPEVNVAADAPQVQEAIGRAIAKGWPAVLHYELRWLAGAQGPEGRQRRMAELRTLLARYPHQPFALIHMAQLDAGDAADLLAAHPNLVFLTSHANPIAVNESRQPWTDMFADGKLAPEWQALMLRHPDRFVLAIDNVWREHWSERYVQQVELWRRALAQLPAEVAHAVAHKNAERLWNLPPAVAGQGCAALKAPR
jgi:hypothetical protein